MTAPKLIGIDEVARLAAAEHLDEATIDMFIERGMLPVPVSSDDGHRLWRAGEVRRSIVRARDSLDWTTRTIWRVSCLAAKVERESPPLSDEQAAAFVRLVIASAIRNMPPAAEA